tara:strand:- start:1743 stop:1916 length:174 start_codon:yes stop_codon:yes gene_type:complete
MDYQLQEEQRDYAEAQLEVLKRIEIETQSTRFYCKAVFLNTLAIAMLLIGMIYHFQM